MELTNLKKHLGVTLITFDGYQWTKGNRIVRKAIYTDGEKFYCRGIQYNSLTYKGKEYKEVEEVNGHWFFK